MASKQNNHYEGQTKRRLNASFGVLSALILASSLLILVAQEAAAASVSSITLSASQTFGFSSTQFGFTAVVKDGAGNPVPNVTVNYFVDGVLYSSALTNSNGMAYRGMQLQLGTHTVVVKTTDNVVVSNTAKVYVQLTSSAPVVSITSPSAGATVSGTTTVTALAGSSVGISKVDLYVDGVLKSSVTGTNTQNLDSYSLPLVTSGLTSGQHTLQVKATSSWNVVGTSTNVIVNVSGSQADTTPPLAPVISTPASGSSTNDNTPTFAGTAEALSTVRLYDGTNTTPKATTTASSTGSWSATSSTLSSGTHSLTAKATDAAGNTSPASAAKSITIDTTAPKVSISSPSSGSTIRGTVTLTATATDNVGVSKVELYVDNSYKLADTSSPYNFSLNTSALKNGNHTLLVKAFDKAGNVATNSVTVKVIG